MGVSCPAGTWSDAFSATECELCPAGKWNSVQGSRLSSDCASCPDGSCLLGGSVRVTIQLRSLAQSDLSEAAQRELSRTFAQGIASAAGVANTSVVNLAGQESTVTIRQSTVSAFLLHLAGSSVSSFELAESFYGHAFPDMLVSSTSHILGQAFGELGVVSVALDRESFTPEVPTTTATTTLTSTATATATATISGSDG